MWYSISNQINLAKINFIKNQKNQQAGSGLSKKKILTVIVLPIAIIVFILLYSSVNSNLFQGKIAKGWICQNSTTITVTDSYNRSIPDAFIDVYENNKNYPFAPYLENDLRYSGLTNSEGKFVLDPKKMPNFNALSGFHVVVKKSGYLPRFLNTVQCGLISSKKYTIKITSLPSYNSDINDAAKKQMLPVKILSDQPYLSQYEKADRTIYFPYVPAIREDLLKNVQTIDVTLKVVAQPFVSANGDDLMPIGMSASQNFSFYYEKTNSNLKPGKEDVFEFSLPEGFYYFYFTVTLHRSENDKPISYDYYPNYFQWGFSYPEIAKDKADTSSHYKSSILIYKVPTYSSFAPIIPDHNNNDEKRVNIVFFNVDFDVATFQKLLNYVIQDGNLAFMKLEPFKSNLDHFNFWYYVKPLTSDEIDWNPSVFDNILLGEKDLSEVQKLYFGHSFNGKAIFYVIVNDETLSGTATQAGSGKCFFRKGVTLFIPKDKFNKCLAKGNIKSCSRSFGLDRVFIHEMGHELGMLGEEYKGNPYKLFDPEKYAKDNNFPFNPNIRANNFFASEIDVSKYCSQAVYSGGEIPFNYFVDEIICTNAQASLCAKSSWADLIGNGCGKDSVIDCEATDPNYYQEIGCFFNGGEGELSYANILKPSSFSIMELGGKFLKAYNNSTDKSRVYNPANERTLCEAIEIFSGSATGICDEF